MKQNKKLTDTTNIEDYIGAGGKPDSSVNQRIRDRLVDREVQACASTLIYELTRTPAFADNDELLDLNSRLDWETPAEEAGWLAYDDLTHVQQEAADDDYSDLTSPTFVKIDSDRDDIAETSDALSWQDLCEEQGIEADTREVYEHWIITEWFGEQLKAHDETVVEFMGLTIWGRCTTGQSISMDHVIAAVAARMGILAGQPNSWSSDAD